MNYRQSFLGFSFLLTGSFLHAQQPKNISLHKPVLVSSAAAAYPASNITDGIISRTSKWEAATSKAPHIVEIDLQHYYIITELRVHSGILDAEKKPDEMNQAAGFWSLKNFKLQYWDDANWSDFPNSEVHENRLASAFFTFNPAVTTYKIRLICDDGEPVNIMEMEAIGTEAPNMPAPPVAGPSFTQQVSQSGPQTATVTVREKITGKTMKYVGYNQGYYMPGSNVSAWVEYSQVNSFRVWATLNSFVPQSAVQVDSSLSSVDQFDNRKKELRTSPEKNRFIQWNKLLPLYDLPDSSSTNAMVFNYALSELKRLGIAVVLQMGSTDFTNDWANKWKQWQRYYALAYHSARRGNVNMFAMQNEPNHRNSGPMKLDQWITGMQIVSDAIHCAVEDVNKKYGKKLIPQFVGPVTAGQNTDWWAAIAKAMRTDYHGKTVNKDLLEIFSTHSYNSPAVGYASRISNIRKILEDNHPLHQSPPIVYTEIGRWMNAYLIDKEETMDSPSLFTEWAGIYANNMKNGGYGMWAFKFANTSSGPYPLGIKSGHHYIWQGRRIVEDAYTNLAANKQVSSSTGTNPSYITDNNKSDASAWLSDSASTEKWIEIDLGNEQQLGSAVIYTGSASGVYTAPDRIKNFKLQYTTGTDWKDIPGTAVKDNKYAQVFTTFTQPVSARKVRFTSTDKGLLKVREIKLFGTADGPSRKPSYDVSGIQRTGEVVRLFAKGFKDERPLLETTNTANDSGLDTYTSYDEKTGNYYCWLVQRGLFTYNLQLDLSGLAIAAGSPVTVEAVNPNYYGEVSQLSAVPADKKISLSLPAQSVMLVTIPKRKTIQQIITASADATVAGGTNSTTSYATQNELEIQLDAASPSNNKVTYIWFNLAKLNKTRAQRVVLKVNGRTDKDSLPYRLHVYSFATDSWNAKQLNWNSAPFLNSKEALAEKVGTSVFVAGELAFTNRQEDHWLDVTDLIKRHSAKGIGFMLVRETRQLGDDEDKGKKVIIQSAESNARPQLLTWSIQ